MSLFLRLGVIAGVILVLLGWLYFGTSPAKAAGDKPIATPEPVVACENEMDDVVRRLLMQGSPVIVVLEEALPHLLERLEAAGMDPEGITRAFVAELPVNGVPGVVIGLERNGCLEPPILQSDLIPASTKSGLVDGLVFA